MNLIQLRFFVEKPVCKVLFKRIQPFGRYSGQTQTEIVVVVVLKLRGYYSLCPLIQIVCKKELTNKICDSTTRNGRKTTQVFISCGTSQYLVFWQLSWRNGLKQFIDTLFFQQILKIKSHTKSVHENTYCFQKPRFGVGQLKQICSKVFLAP